MNAHVHAPALRYHGGKFRLAPWLLQYFPEHQTYVEPFGGGASVLLQKPRVYAEVYNDLDGDIVNFFRVLRDPISRAALIEACHLTPYAREEFAEAFSPAECPVERARRTAVRASMGFGSDGATKDATGFRIDTARAYGTAQGIWADYPPKLAIIGERFTGVLIENKDAIEVIKNHRRPDTLFYVDPPYVHSTRQMKGNGRYRCEMTDQQHEDLLTVMRESVGMFILSGYDNPLYSRMLSDWLSFSKTARIAARRGAGIRLETIWMNPACYEAYQGQGGVLPL